MRNAIAVACAGWGAALAEVLALYTYINLTWWEAAGTAIVGGIFTYTSTWVVLSFLAELAGGTSTGRHVARLADPEPLPNERDLTFDGLTAHVRGGAR